MNFSWRSLFKVYAVIAIPTMLIMSDAFSKLSGIEFLFGVSLIATVLFALAAMLYIAIAPFVAVFVLTIREYRQTRSIRKAVKWPVEIVGGLLFAAAFIYVVGSIGDWLRSFSAGRTIIDIFRVLFWIAIIGAVYDRYANRGKKLKSYTPSDRTDIAKK